MAMSAERTCTCRSKLAALHRQWWRLHMSEKFSSGMKNHKQTKHHKTTFLCSEMLFPPAIQEEIGFVNRSLFSINHWFFREIYKILQDIHQKEVYTNKMDGIGTFTFIVDLCISIYLISFSWTFHKAACIYIKNIFHKQHPGNWFSMKSL